MREEWMETWRWEEGQPAKSQPRIRETCFLGRNGPFPAGSQRVAPSRLGGQPILVPGFR